MRQSDCLPHPGIGLLFYYGVKTTDRRSATKPGNAGRAHSRIGVGIEAVVNKIAQAVIVEAEPHPPQVPQLRLRKAGPRAPIAARILRGRTPASGRSGAERDSAGDTALGMLLLTG
jgi:hypothetical protein